MKKQKTYQKVIKELDTSCNTCCYFSELREVDYENKNEKCCILYSHAKKVNKLDQETIEKGCDFHFQN